MRYGNLIYDKRNNRVNLGDDMQILSIENLYRTMGVDYSDVLRIKYSELTTYEGDYVVLPVSFPVAAYFDNGFVTCFSERIIPVFLGLCLVTDVLACEDVEYLRRFAPIGCRDLHTLKVMRSYGIPSYLNGCMTLTLPRREEAGSGTHVYLVDVPDDLLGLVPEHLREDAVRVSPIVYLSDLDCIPEEAARSLYDRYIKDARLVITTRLHVALPCFAAGLPVVFLKPEYSFRFAGIDAVVPFYDAARFDEIDWDPASLDFENHKKEVRDLAEHRIRKAFTDNEKMLSLSERLEQPKRPAYYVEGVDNAKQFVDSTWDVRKEGTYALWGMTQAAAALENHIRRRFPHMRLVAAIDISKDMEMGGMHTCLPEEAHLERDTVLFCCAAAAGDASSRYAHERGIENYYNCYNVDDRLVNTGVRNA